MFEVTCPIVGPGLRATQHHISSVKYLWISPRIHVESIAFTSDSWIGVRVSDECLLYTWENGATGILAHGESPPADPPPVPQSVMSALIQGSKLG